MNGVRLTMVGLPSSAICSGEKRSCPPGIPSDACCSLPMSSWYYFTGVAAWRNTFLLRRTMLLHFSSGSWMV
eukprot:12533731-Ditylum_brightwellii.AAC.1